MTSCKWLALWEIKNSNKKFKYKICKKEIETYNFKVHMENVHKGLKKYNWTLDERDILQLLMKKRFNCDQCGKNLATGCNSLPKIFTNHIYKLELVSHIRVSIDRDPS